MKKLIFISALFLITCQKKVTAQSPKFIFANNFVQLDNKNLHDFDNNFKKELPDLVDKKGLKFSSQEIKRIIGRNTNSKSDLYFLDSNGKAEISVKKSTMDIMDMAFYPDELCEHFLKEFNKISEVTEFDCGIKSKDKLKIGLIFVLEFKFKDIGGGYKQRFGFNWSCQYWVEQNDINYHITINSSNGLKIEDVLKEIR